MSRGLGDVYKRQIKKTIDFSLIDGNIEGVEKSGEATRDETDSQ